MFGGTFTTLAGETGRTLFSDTPGMVTDYSVTFTTDSPITLTGYNLYLAEDPATPGNRSVTEFRLLEGSTTVSDVTLLNLGETYAGQYGSFKLELSDSFAPVTGSTFTAIFISNDLAANGPRIEELDATTVPEPATLPMVLGALGALVWRRTVRKGTPPRCQVFKGPVLATSGDGWKSSKVARERLKKAA
jgi:hypothetical protein